RCGRGRPRPPRPRVRCAPGNPPAGPGSPCLDIEAGGPGWWDRVEMRPPDVFTYAHAARRRTRRDLGVPARGRVRPVLLPELTAPVRSIDTLEPSRAAARPHSARPR